LVRWTRDAPRVKVPKGYRKGNATLPLSSGVKEVVSVVRHAKQELKG
jgi:hypothetical protein